jgi:hypothetical protein
MSTVEWLLVGACWSLIPAVLLLKAYLDHQSLKAQRELDAALAVWHVRQRSAHKRLPQGIN